MKRCTTRCTCPFCRMRKPILPGNRKGQVMIYLTFIVASIVILLIAAIFAPMGVLFNTEMYAAGERIMLLANASVSDINDSSVRAAVYDAIDEGLQAQENNIEVNADIYQYSWIIMIVLTALVSFIYTRRLVEYGGGGFV